MKFKFVNSKFRPLFDFDLLYIPSLHCTFKCFYCPTYNNTLKVSKQHLDKHKEFIYFLGEKYIYTKNKNITLYGGEPTENIDVVSFINFFKKQNWKFTILTNLSLDKDYLNRILSDIDSKKLYWIVSLHLHRIKDLQLYIEKLKTIQQNGNMLTIRVMIEKNQRDKILRIFNLFSDKYDNVKVINRLIYPIDKLCDIELYEELKEKYPNSTFYVLYNNKKLNLRDFIDSKYNNFKNYHCTAGQKSLVLNYNGDVFLCETMFIKDKFKYLNIFSEDYTKRLPIKHNILCPCKQCRCELWLEKRK